MGNCREENKVRSYGDADKELTLHGVMREGFSEGVNFEFRSEERVWELGMGGHFLAEETTIAKTMRQTVVGLF